MNSTRLVSLGPVILSQRSTLLGKAGATRFVLGALALAACHNTAGVEQFAARSKGNCTQGPKSKMGGPPRTLITYQMGAPTLMQFHLLPLEPVSDPCLRRKNPRPFGLDETLLELA